MAKYYVNTNAQENGDHEVHRKGCMSLRKAKDPEFLGDFSNAGDAVDAARPKYPKANGCAYCCPECHSS